MGEALTRRLDDGRTIGFSNNPMADLSDIHQRMPFVLRAAAQFDELLRNGNRHRIEQAIQDIAVGLGVR
jgi:putative SOS response-associated peptidase YedK